MKLQKYTLDDFSGGFAANSNEDTMSPGFSPNCFNVDITGGALKTCSGCELYTDAPIVDEGLTFYPERLMVYFSIAGTVGDELCVCGTSYGCKGFFRFVEGEWVRYDENISDGEMGCVNYHYNDKNYLLVCNSYDGIYKYLSTPRTFEYIEDSEPLSSMALHYGRLWGIGNSDHPNTVYYSEYGNPSGWDTSADAGAVTVTTFDGDKFVGIANVFDDIVLYRRKSLFRISGSTPSSYQLVQIPSQSGAAGPKAFANNGRYSFFVSEDGIFSFDGLRATVLENNRLRYFFENEVNKSAIENTCAEILGNKLYVAVPTGSSAVNNVIIEYDICEKIFNVRKGITVLDMVAYQNRIMFIDQAFRICILGSGNKYCSDNIVALYETPFTDFDSKSVAKTLDCVRFTAKGNGKIKITAESENDISSTTVMLKSQDHSDVYCVPLYCSGRRFRFSFENVNGSSFELVRPEFLLENDEED